MRGASERLQAEEVGREGGVGVGVEQVRMEEGRGGEAGRQWGG